eukprot:snap_masked-scaffold_16-processed-gene-1.62-mRNA-1 protein AED:1.00 eAED:1.00 QI:0/0/0/0/1/1/2/0/343
MIFLSSFLFLIIIKRVKSQLELRATVLSGTSHSSCDNSVFNRDDEAVFAIKAEPESKYAFYNGEGYNCPKHNPDDDGPDEFYSEEVSCSDQYETMEFCVVSGDDNRATLTCSGDLEANGLNSLNDLGCKKTKCETINFIDENIFCFEGFCDKSFEFPLNPEGDKTRTEGVVILVEQSGFCPTSQPSSSPTFSPSISPTFSPSFHPTKSPSNSPTYQPTKSPSNSPTYCGSEFDPCSGEDVDLCLSKENVENETETDPETTSAELEEETNEYEEFILYGIGGFVLFLGVLFFIFGRKKKSRKKTILEPKEETILEESMQLENINDDSVYFDQGLKNVFKDENSV